MSSPLKQNTTTIQEILNTVNSLPEAGGQQETPIISVNSSNGLITATAGTKSSTHQLAFQAAKTITPTAASQIAVSSGYYTGGSVVVAGDSDLVADNIKSGVNIFGVTGTYEGSGSGGDASAEDGLVTRTATNYTNDRVTSIGNNTFYLYESLTSVSFPEVTTIGYSAFNYCINLTSVSFPKATSIRERAFYTCMNLTSVSFPETTSIENYAFYNCSSLTSVSFPETTSIGSNAFTNCIKLTSVSFPKATSIGSNAFYNCSSLTSIYLKNSSVCALAHSSAFSNTGIWSTKGSIFVPSSLVASYKAATNWVFFSNRIYSA